MNNESWRSNVRFNASHSGSLALYAFSGARAVGVDVETRSVGEARRKRLALRAFGECESCRLDLLESAAQEREFLRLWTRHEAALKCIGTGLRARPDHDRGGRAPSARVWLTDLDVGVAGAAAVASPMRPRQVCVMAWPSGRGLAPAG